MTSPTLEPLPIAVIGGGPVGLAAATHLLARKLPVKLYETGSTVGANMLDWGHVRVFTSWRHCMDATCVALLEAQGWKAPPPDTFPTGDEIVRSYLEPLAATPEVARVVETHARVTAISRLGLHKAVSRGRAEQPFVLSIKTPAGTRRDFARAVIDASGTWATPNPLGANGLPADGETELSQRIVYGIPDILGRQRHLYAGRTTLVVGAGHSAANALLDLAQIAQTDPATTVLWATRSVNLARVYGGGNADQLPARGELGARIRELAESGRVSLIKGFAIVGLRIAGDRVMVDGDTPEGVRTIGPVDRIIAATGQRPDLSLTRELALDLDPRLESTKALGPLIDPNEHSCGSVPPHGHRELAHLEPGFYTVGIKSYGRAPTFLLLTGYEQVRSVVAALAGDMAAADNVHLALPETGVCSTALPGKGSEVAQCGGNPVRSSPRVCGGTSAFAKEPG